MHKGIVKVKAINEVEALKAKENGGDKVIVAEISGAGLLDLEPWGRKMEL